MKSILMTFFTFTLFISASALAGHSFLEGENLVYTIEGEEATDMFESFTKDTGAYENGNGDRIMIRMEYNQASAANIRIRTKITCFKAKPLCRVGVSHLTFIPYPGR